MKIKNFRFEYSKGEGVFKTFHAVVEVTSGILFWKKTEDRKVCRKVGSSWFFADTGKWCPGFEVENLENVWVAEHGDLNIQ